jgi:hypothetical protein
VITAVALAIAAAALAVVSASGQGEEGLGGEPAGPPACSVVAERPSGAPRPLRKATEVWIQCNFEVLHVTLRSNKAVGAVQSAPALHGADPEDSLTCEPRGTRRIACRGSMGTHARAQLGLRLRRPACEPRPFRVRARMSGGLDCDSGTACPDIGFVATAASGRTLGC